MAVGLGSLALGVLLACGAPMQGNAKLEVEELGLVRWERDHEQAFLKAKQGNKPVLLLFQEIPG